MLLHLHANPLQIEPHLLQHVDGHSLSKFDQTEQEVFSSHVIVVEPLGLLASKRKDLLGARSKIIHHYVSDAGPATGVVEFDTTPGLQTFTIKAKKIDRLASENVFMSLFAPTLRQQSWALLSHLKKPARRIKRSGGMKPLIRGVERFGYCPCNSRTVFLG